MQPTRASLSPESPRYADWIQVFRTDRVELEQPLPILGDLPGLGTRHVYKLKLSALTADQRARLIDFLCARFNLPLDDVCVHLERDGCPILADDVRVSLDMRYVQ